MCVASSTVAQVQEIERRLWERNEKVSNLELKVKHIEEILGNEADVVIISTVGSTSVGSAGIIIHRQRLNISLTKAR